MSLDDGVARLTLDRPDAGNAIDLATAEALARATAELRVDADVRVVVLRGAGSRFCVGGDLREFAGRDDLPDHLARVTDPLHRALADLAAMPAPVVCGVQGAAAGAGFSLAVAADVCIATRSARFVLAYTALGLTPDGSGSWYLPRVVGLARALDLALTNRPLTADEAVGMGLIARVVDDDALDAEVDGLAGALRSGSAHALAATKRLLRESGDRDLESQLAAERETLSAAAAVDGVEGVTAFVAKRPPDFG